MSVAERRLSLRIGPSNAMPGAFGAIGALATVVWGPVMLSFVAFANRTRRWFPEG